MNSNRKRFGHRVGRGLIFVSLVVAGYLIFARFDPRRAAEPAAEPGKVEQTSVDDRRSGATEGGSKESYEVAVAERMQATIDRMWWNREKHYVRVGLEPHQREKMNERVTEYLLEQRQSTHRSDAFDEFRTALIQRQYDTARQRAEALGHAYSVPVEAQARMMVDVLEILTPEQHRRLVDNKAGLLSGPWLLNRSLRAEAKQGPAESPTSAAAAETLQP
ncbi:MAG: hypothetical protein MPN21_02875 [Thermoanaerobaculia bacterium]|nr:hypothetical protein [Thermoanaerobaculia bacterium]